MEEQFILRVPPSVAERIERLLNEDPSSSEDNSLDLSFSEDGRSGTFAIGNDSFPASLFDLPTITESYKSYDDSVLIKTADIGQMILVREGGGSKPDMVEYKHGLTPPMRDARRRRFRREPDLNPELVQGVENALLSIMNSRGNEGPTQEEDGEDNSRNVGKKPAPTSKIKATARGPASNAAEEDGSDTDESDDSV
ncbi:transcription initiation factor TFIID subunit 7 isoform X2 [Silene latifolia]|uniref:transcription initiation factor TFIID subunit 7 isoform X2 n=1 Tax=Silene latifolia TaxID=37657 RepID=UPI003D787636